jgi:hypothetical protein
MPGTSGATQNNSVSERSREKQKARQAEESRRRAERGEPYTIAELDELMRGDPMAIDDMRVHAMMALIPGRYYSRMFFVNYPDTVNPPHGGDISACLFRRDDQPERWIFSYRFRYYAGSRKWDNKDERSYYKVVMDGDEAKAVESVRNFFNLIAELGNKKPHEFIIQGDSEKANRLMEDEATRPFWMTRKKATVSGPMTAKVMRGINQQFAQEEINETN